MSGWFKVTLPKHIVSEKSGFLTVAEIKEITNGLFCSAPRIYFVVNNTNVSSVRGCHRHPEKKELIVCAHGIITVELHAFDCCGIVLLDDPTKGLVIDVGTWHKHILEPSSVLIGITSVPYNQHESINNRALNCYCLR